MLIILYAQDIGFPDKHKENITSLFGLSEEEASGDLKDVLTTILEVCQVDWIG